MTLYRDKYRIESSRLHDWDYRSLGWYFVTICTQARVPIFGKVVAGEVKLSSLGLIADFELKHLHEHYENVQVDEHVVMPNHVHAIVMIDGEALLFAWDRDASKRFSRQPVGFAIVWFPLCNCSFL